MKPRLLVPGLRPGDSLPDPRRATSEGLVAIGGDLSLPRLIEAYRKGIFPWSVNPVSWWSPDPRCIIPIENFHIPRRLARKIRQHTFRVTFDTAFDAVMVACAKPGPGRGATWIEGEMFAAYSELHRCGHAHSVECWMGKKLVGGVYGVALGGFFAGESMFHRETDASKVALTALMERLQHQGFQLFDTQAGTPHTRRLGAIDIPREDYLQRLTSALKLPVRF